MRERERGMRVTKKERSWETKRKRWRWFQKENCRYMFPCLLREAWAKINQKHNPHWGSCKLRVKYYCTYWPIDPVAERLWNSRHAQIGGNFSWKLMKRENLINILQKNAMIPVTWWLEGMKHLRLYVGKERKQRD